MQLNDVDHGVLRRLAALRPGAGKVLTLYVNLDPAEFGTPPARAAEIGALVDDARRRVRETAPDRSTRLALLADVDRADGLLRGHDGFSSKGAHALAIFAAAPLGLFEVLRLPEAVPGAAVVDDRPWLDPLVGRVHPRRCLALVNRRALRVLLDTADGELREVADLLDDVHGQHDQGGWSQARWERGIEEEVRRHLEHVAVTLFELLRWRPYQQLVVGAGAELWPELERLLHPYVRERLIGRFDLDVENASVDAALDAARPLLEAAHERRVRRLLDRLQSGLAHERRAAAGPEAVLDALTARRVEALLYEAGFQAPGFACAASGWLGVRARDCPTGEDHARPQGNVLEAAIAAALLQGAEVVGLHDRAELGPHGGIAAVLRF